MPTRSQGGIVQVSVGQLISADRLTTFQPGVTYNGGITNRTTIFTTLNPLGGASDDTAQIQNALDTCPAGQVVLLGPGTFNISGNGINVRTSNITLRGAGPGPGSAIASGSPGPATAPGTYTALWKTDSNLFGGTSPFGLLYVNQFQGQFINSGISTNLTSDAVKGAKSCTVASVSGLSVGTLVLIDIWTDNHPLVYWGNRVEDPGAIFTGSVSGTSLTVSSVTTGTIAINQNVFYSNGLVGTIASGSGLNWTLQSAGPTITGQQMSSGFGTRRFFCRQDRSLCQIMKIANISGLTVTFETIFHIDYPVAYFAQLTHVTDTEITGVGIENLYLYGGVGGDGNGNLPFSFCSYSWAKNVEAHYSDGTGISFQASYRCECRDSYMHESPNPRPGGGGYLSGINFGSADCLFENNIMWCGNKVNVMRSSGGGNVFAYNYMDDPFGDSYPMSPEAGVNAGHFTTPHFELLEGNYSHQYKGDDFWGSSIYITVFRNWFTGLRAAGSIHTNWIEATSPTNASSAAGTNTLSFTANNVSGPGTTGVDIGFLVKDLTTAGVIPAGTKVTAVTATSVTLDHNIAGAGVGSGDSIQFTWDGTLNNYKYFDGQTIHYPYIDSWGRSCCDIEAYSFNNNFCANVLGYSGYPHFLGFTSGSTTYQQTTIVYQNLGTTFSPTGTSVEMYTIGIQNNPNGQVWIAGQDTTLQRDGNWDWFTQSQRWHGVGGSVGSRAPVPIPNSYYLSGAPAFWGATPWPWVDPSTGTTYTLPAKARFETLSGLSPIPPGNQ